MRKKKIDLEEIPDKPEPPQPHWNTNTGTGPVLVIEEIPDTDRRPRGVLGILVALVVVLIALWVVAIVLSNATISTLPPPRVFNNTSDFMEVFFSPLEMLPMAMLAAAGMSVMFAVLTFFRNN